MIDRSKNIEQMVYTACGKTGNGEFGIWASSKGVDDKTKNIYFGREEYQFNGLSSILAEGRNARTEDKFEALISSQKILKAGAVPKGIFKKTYREEDYYTVDTSLRGPVFILDESTKGRLKDAIPYDADFRENPEDAPYRVIATKLPDNRLLVVRRTYINRVYSNMDSRTGNFLDNVMVFPAGTEIGDIDVAKIPFVKGLEPEQYKSEKFPNRKFTPAPDHMPPVDLTPKKESTTRPQASINPLLLDFLFSRGNIIATCRRDSLSLKSSKDFDVQTQDEINELSKKSYRAQGLIQEKLQNVDKSQLSYLNDMFNNKDMIDTLVQERQSKAEEKGEEFDASMFRNSLKILGNYTKQEIGKRATHRE